MDDLNDQAPEVKSMEPQESIGSKIFKIFLEPSTVFKNLSSKWEWIVPIVVAGVLAGLAGHFARPYYVQDMETQVYDNMRKYEQYMSAEQYEETMTRVKENFEEARKNEFKWFYPFIFIGMPLVIALVISLVGKVIGNFVFGGRASFWMVLNVVAYAALIGALGDVLRNALIIWQETMHIYTGLGLLRPVIGDGSFLFYLFRQIDLFTVWRIIVTCIGLGIIYNMKPQKFAYVLFPIWLIFIAIVAGLNLFAGGTIIY